MKLSFLFYEPILDLAELSRRIERLAVLGFVTFSQRNSPEFRHVPPTI
jgi:hypothetical protein